MKKLAWRMKLEAELGSGAMTDVDIGRIERDSWASAFDVAGVAEPICPAKDIGR
jgi:hypothetical protein